MKIVGLKIEKYIGKSVSGHNCDFEYVDDEFERHILFGILSNDKKVRIELSTEDGVCGSGWTTASWGHIDVQEVTKFDGYTYKPKKNIVIDDIFPHDEKEYIKNQVFSVSYDGGDSYYPSGGYHVDMDLFIKTDRHKDKRPVWIFTGESNSGKSFLSSHITELNTYETDSNSVLPENITEDIIVLGNKYEFSIDDVRNKIYGEHELCIVSFEIE